MSTVDSDVGGWADYPQIGSGWGFPVQWDYSLRADGSRSGLLNQSAGAARIEEALVLILRTGISERVMRPKFGAGVDRYVFDPRADEVCRGLEADVRRALLLSEPRVIVDNVTARPAGLAGERIDVEIAYRIDRHRRPENLVLPFYLAGGRS